MFMAGDIIRTFFLLRQSEKLIHEHIKSLGHVTKSELKVSALYECRKLVGLLQ